MMLSDGVEIKSNQIMLLSQEMERREDKLFYCCAIPRKIVVPEGFVSKEIASYKYMVVEHIGSMDKIYETYSKIYKEILPNT